MDLLEDLTARGLIADTTDRDAFARRLAVGPITLYCGFDPTAASLHVGNLMGLLTLRRFQLAGHKPICVAGGATGMIGDPSGRSDERSLLDDDTLAQNMEGIVPQLRQFVDFDDRSTPAQLLDNRAWTVGVGVLEFLRDVGRHVTVNQMVGKESVRSRMTNGDGLSYTEFSYMLLQAYDFLWLAENTECELQIGGSDQWGNMVLGVDLIRRRLGRQAHALTWPLLTRSDGTKYGKTAGGETIWLSPDHMSPYRFHQAWIGIADEEVESLLAKLTFLSLSEIAEIVCEHMDDPSRRLGQRRLADELTTLVHGEQNAQAAAQAAEMLFGSQVDVREVSTQALSFVAKEVPTSALTGIGAQLVDVLASTELAKSKGDARRAISEGGIYVNGERVTDAERTIEIADVLHGSFVLLRRGKKTWHIATV